VASYWIQRIERNCFYSCNNPWLSIDRRSRPHSPLRVRIPCRSHSRAGSDLFANRNCLLDRIFDLRTHSRCSHRNTGVWRLMRLRLGSTVIGSLVIICAVLMAGGCGGSADKSDAPSVAPSTRSSSYEPAENADGELSGIAGTTGGGSRKEYPAANPTRAEASVASGSDHSDGNASHGSKDVVGGRDSRTAPLKIVGGRIQADPTQTSVAQEKRRIRRSGPKAQVSPPDG
jgi:hypothetical protein